LIGVALGTLIAVGAVSMFVLFPAACRRVQLSMREALKSAIFPSVWPLVVMASFLAITRNFFAANLPAIGLQAVTAALIYLAVFLLVAIDREDRQWYVAKARELLRRASAAAAA
jgi:hypothetical protein